MALAQKDKMVQSLLGVILYGLFPPSFNLSEIFGLGLEVICFVLLFSV